MSMVRKVKVKLLTSFTIREPFWRPALLQYLSLPHHCLRKSSPFQKSLTSCGQHCPEFQRFRQWPSSKCVSTLNLGWVSPVLIQRASRPRWSNFIICRHHAFSPGDMSQELLLCCGLPLCSPEPWPMTWNFCSHPHCPHSSSLP